MQSKRWIVYASSSLILCGLLWSPTILAEAQSADMALEQAIDTMDSITNEPMEEKADSSPEEKAAVLEETSVSQELETIHKKPVKETDTLSSSPSEDGQTFDNESAVTSENIVENPNFEQTKTILISERGNTLWKEKKADSWQTYSDKTKTKGDPTVTVNDKGQLVLTNDSGNSFRGCVHQKIAINPEKQYVISFDIETKEKTGQAFLRIIEEKKT